MKRGCKGKRGRRREKGRKERGVKREKEGRERENNRAEREREEAESGSSRCWVWGLDLEWAQRSLH